MWQSPWVVVAAVFVAVGAALLVYFTAFDNGSGGRTATPGTTTTSTQTVRTTTQQATTATTATTEQTTTEQETTTAATTETAPATTTSTTSTTTTTATTPTAPAPTVPNVKGTQMSAAIRRLVAAGYYADTAPLTDKSAPRGTVIAEQPRAGAKLAPGKAVRLAISIPAHLPLIKIPDVVGKSAEAARAELVASKLTMATKFTSAGASKTGKVIAQSPFFGTFRQYVQVTILVGK